MLPASEYSFRAENKSRLPDRPRSAPLGSRGGWTETTNSFDMNIPPLGSDRSARNRRNVDTPRGFRVADRRVTGAAAAHDVSEAHAYRRGGDTISTPAAGGEPAPHSDAALSSSACRSESPVRPPTKFSGQLPPPRSLSEKLPAGLANSLRPRNRRTSIHKTPQPNIVHQPQHQKHR